MEFSTKKMICKLSAIVIALSSAVAMALPAFADGILVVGPTSVSNFIGYTNTYYNSNSHFYVCPSGATLTVSNYQYMYNLKEASFDVYKTVNGNFVRINSYNAGYNSNTNLPSVTSSSFSYNESIATKKYYWGRVYNSSYASSGIKEGYTVDIRKS